MLVLKNINRKRTQYLSARTESLIRIKKEQSKISRKGKSERIISQNVEFKNRESCSGRGYSNEHKKN